MNAPRIDAHQHFWTLARGDYRWLTPALAPLHRDFGPDDLAPHLSEARVDSTVLVQAADSVAETEFLLSIARSTPFVAGVVGWVELDAAQAPRELERLAREPKFVGVRPMLQDLDDERWILRPRVIEALRTAQKLGLRFDALVKPRQLPALCELRAALPELSIVIDHAAKPELAHGAAWRGWNEWRARLGELAGAPRTCCKFSGLVTECGSDWSVSALSETTEFLRATFGAERLLWGSDWPVVELASSYAHWRKASDELTRSWNSRERAQLFGATAASFYGLPVSLEVGPGR